MSNAMRLGKRSLAGVAAGALVAGVIPFAIVATATSASAISSTGTVTPVRYVGTGITNPNSPSAYVLWDKDNAPTLLTTGTPSIQLTGTNAVSGTGRLIIDDSTGAASQDDTFWALTLGSATDDTALASANEAVVFGATADDSFIRVRAGGAGTYSGRIFNGTDTVSFSFTTTGTATSMTLTPASQSIPVAGATEATVTLLDSTGAPTQPDFNGTISLSATTGMTTAPSTSTGLVATDLATSEADIDLTGFATAGTYTLTATPSGSLLGVAAKSATVTASGTVRSTATGNLTVSVPDNAYNSAAATFPTKTSQTPAGTTAVSILVDDDTAAITGSRTVRLAVYNQSGIGTINGSTDDTQYFNVAIDSSSEVGTLDLTLAGGAQASGRVLVVTQVDAANAAVSVGATRVTLTNTQTTPVVQADGVVPTPGGQTVAAVGATTAVSVQVDDSFGNPATNYTVTATRTNVNGSSVSTALSSGQTNSAGTASVTVSPLSTTTNGQYEIYTFSAESNASGADVTGSLTLQVNYTTGGTVSAVSVVPSTGATRTNTSTSFTTFPAIYTAENGDDTVGAPLDGLVGTVVSGGIATQNSTTGAITVTTSITSSLTTFRVNTTPQSAYTVTAPTGVKLYDEAPTATTLYSTGSSSVNISADDSVWVWATKTGNHELTFSAGGVSVVHKLRVNNLGAASAFNVALSPATQSLATGAIGSVTATVTDMFGNIVTGTVGGMTITGSALYSGNQPSVTLTTGSAGTFTPSVIAGTAAGTAALTAALDDDYTDAAGSTYSAPTGISAPAITATATATVTAAPVPVASSITWGTVPVTVSAGSITSLEATVKDQNGAVMTGEKVDVLITGSATLGTSGTKSGVYETNSEGKITVGVLAGETGTFTVKATAQGSSAASATTTSVTIDPRPVPKTITVLPAGGGVVPSSVAAGSSVAMVATVKDDDGNPEASEAVEVSITGDATFANGNKQYVANTGAAGTLGFTVIAGASGSFTVTATVVSTPSVTTTTSSISITPAPVTKTITIMGGRGEGADPVPSGETCRSVAEAGEELPDRCITADGMSTGFSTGSAMTPQFRFPGQTTYSPGTAVNTDAAGEFDWFRKTGKKIYVKFTSDGVTSNMVIIDAR